MKRNYTLDIMRTFAIALMVVFHFIYDLKYFGFVEFDIPDGPGWQQFRWVIVSLFFLCLGASLVMAHSNQLQLWKLSKRVLQIALGAAAISIGSFYFIRENWIFFGVLHFLALSAVLAVWFVKVPWVALVIGSAFLIMGALEVVPARWPFHLLFDGLPSYTNDYVAFIPWFGMVLMGVFLGHQSWFKQDPLRMIDKLKAKKVLVWPGQNSLSIYLLHQPILIGLLYVFFVR